MHELARFNGFSVRDGDHVGFVASVHHDSVLAWPLRACTTKAELASLWRLVLTGASVYDVLAFCHWSINEGAMPGDAATVMLDQLAASLADVPADTVVDADAVPLVSVVETVGVARVEAPVALYDVARAYPFVPTQLLPGERG